MPATRIVTPPGYETVISAFREVEETVQHGLDALGRKLDREIIFAPHLLPSNHKSEGILYNLEQRGTAMLSKPGVLDVFRRHEVWDYSTSNVEWLAAREVRAKHVPIGYMPQMTRITHSDEKDIDVLFYGVLNPRRDRVLASLRSRGLRALHVTKCYGSARDRLISRSKIVLNVHYYSTNIFEIVRCSHLFANKVCVVSEESIDVPAELIGTFPLVPYGNLVEVCKELVANESERQTIAEASHQAFTKCAETKYLARVLS